LINIIIETTFLNCHEITSYMIYLVRKQILEQKYILKELELSFDFDFLYFIK